MIMDRAYTNRDEGFVCCCWNAPSLESLKGLFEKAGASFDKMEPVTEHFAAPW